MSLCKQILWAIVVVFLTAGASYESCAQTIDTEQQVLAAISGAAGQICAIAISDSADESRKKVLRRLIEQLAALRMNVQSRGSGEGYAEALQAGLPKNLKDNPDCKLQVIDTLVDAFIHDESVGAEVLLAIKCDRLASHPSDKARPAGIPGLDLARIDSVRAVAACRAASQVHPNDIRLMYQLGRSLQKDGSPAAVVEAARLYKLGADQGYAAAQTNLGVLTESGLGGLAKNDQEAARLYKLAADQGYAPAQYDLGRFYEIGRFYETGRGILAKNDQEAARLYKLAAEQGFAGAQYNLGRFYESGRGGLAQNDREAARFYDLAAEQGYAAENEPMRIVVVRSSQPGCEPKCAEWISAEGYIALATAEELRRVVNSLGGRKLPILLHSRGGASGTAMLMGFLVRKRGLDVAVGRTAFGKCGSGPGGCTHRTWSGPLGEPSLQTASCSSACTYVLAGGVRRFVGPEARVGVHNFNYNSATVEKWRQTYRGTMPMDTIIERSIAPPTVANARTYFRKLGIGEELEVMAVATPTTDIRVLTEAELLKTRLATEIKSGHRADS